jgi:3-hydroxyisobutyrate dehydrogenase-like beta-hydroxyacid dehydrogenase
MANLGFIGLGTMGGRIAHRLLTKGHAVTGYNRTRSKAQWLLTHGLTLADSPRDVARASDVTFVMVSNSAAVESVADGSEGFVAGLDSGRIVVDMSTISPDASRNIAAAVRRHGAEMLDAPVSGSVAALEQGRLSIMVGGSRQAFEQIKPLLEDIGPKVTYIGANGLAVTMKIAANISVAVQMLAFAEGILLAEKSGIARETAVDVLTHSAIGSPMLQYRGPFVVNAPGEAWFTVNMMQKDLLLALELGRRLEVALPTAAATNEWLTAARAMQLGDHDMAAVFQTLARISGVES